jgi:hypothetical protein
VSRPFPYLAAAVAVAGCGTDDIDAVYVAPSGVAIVDGGPSPSDVCASVDPVGPAGSYVPVSFVVACGTRDAFEWPFSKNSIWNIPIGSAAIYVDARLGTLGACNVNNDLVYRETPTDPAVQVVRPDGIAGVDGKGGTGEFVHLPPSFTYKPGPSNGASFFDVDGHTLKEFSAFARADARTNPTGWDFGKNDLTGLGANGGYGGSQLSVIGGTLRQGELTSPAPIHHALKVGFDWVKLSAAWPGKFRWPAKTADGNGSNTYSGPVVALSMGSLVALRPDVDLTAIAWRSPLGRKIAEALRDYGAYVVQSTANGWQWPNGGYTMSISAENGVIAEVKTAFGIDWASAWGGGGDAWTADMSEIYARLVVVDNNTEQSPGGGGVPRRSLAPDFRRSTSTDAATK